MASLMAYESKYSASVCLELESVGLERMILRLIGERECTIDGSQLLFKLWVGCHVCVWGG